MLTTMLILRLSIAAAWLTGSAIALDVCGIPATGSTKVFADIHDGDQKQISLSRDYANGNSSKYYKMTIKPYGNNQTWVLDVEELIDEHICSVMVDFNVPGKPNPPPVPLRLTLQSVQSAAGRRTAAARTAACVFTDPSRTLKDDPTYPLNYWIEIAAAQDEAATVQ